MIDCGGASAARAAGASASNRIASVRQTIRMIFPP
jgi:hypothetical protein